MTRRWLHTLVFVLLYTLSVRPLMAAATSGPLEMSLTPNTSVLFANSVLLEGAGDAQFLCDPARFSLVLKNTGDVPLVLNRYDFIDAHLQLHITGPTPQSVVVTPILMKRSVKDITKDDFITLAPSATWACPEPIMLPGTVGGSLYRFTAPGSYSVRVSYRNIVPRAVVVKDDELATLQAQSWQGAITSAPVTVKMLDAGAAVQGVQMALEATTGPQHDTYTVTAYFRNTGAKPLHIMAWDVMEAGLHLLDKEGRPIPAQFPASTTVS